jgi:NAD(P)-dependent dehydrogenase (short-subunit alcohol dehydrogenase family)
MSKVCVITGGSVGIGRSVVEQFLAAGYSVFNLDLQPADLAHDSYQFIACDVSQSDQVEQAITKVVSASGRIDALVSNAGVHFSANIENTSDEDFERVIGINVKGAFYLVKAVLPVMKAQQSGAIILEGSDQSIVGKTNSFAYNMSKAALASMAKTTALAYASFGIRANAVCPGTIETPLYHQAIDSYCAKSGADKAAVHAEEAALQPLGRIGQPEEVAALILFLASEQAKFITGSLQVIDGGYTAQ